MTDWRWRQMKKCRLSFFLFPGREHMMPNCQNRGSSNPAPGAPSAKANRRNHKSFRTTMTTTNQVPWPTAAGDAQPSAGTVSSQRRAFGDARARLDNAAKQNANTGKPSDNNLPTKEKMSTATSASDAGISKPLSSRRSNAGSSGGESIVAKFGALYGGTTTPSSNSSSNNAADKENASSDHQDTEKSSSAEATAGTSSAGSNSNSRNAVTSPKFQSLRDAFQKRSDSSAGGPGAVIPSLSDGFGGNNNSNNSNGNGNGGRSKSTGRPAAAASSSSNSTRRAARESRSKSTIRPSRGSGVEVYDEGINDDNNNINNATNDDAATTPADAAEFASPQVRVSKSKMQKLKQSNVRLKSEAWEKGLRLHQTQSALYDLKKENEELRSTSNGSAASTPSTAARQSSTSSVASNATESTSSGQAEMYSKLRRNLEGQADTLQAQLDAEVKKSRSLERQIDEMRATSTAANQWSDKKKQQELQNDLSAAMSDLAAKNKEISKLQANLKKATAVAQYDNVNNGDDPIRRREVEIQSLRKSLNDFKSLHSDCDLKTELLTEKEAKLQESQEAIQAANARAEELERCLAEARNSMVLLQNESTRHLEKSLKAKEQDTMQRWSVYKKQETKLREEIAGRDEELDDTRADVRLLESKLEEAEHLVAATVERVDGLKAELSRKDAVAEKANEAMEMLQAKLSIADTNSVVAEKTIGDLEYQLSILDGQKSELLDGLEKSAEQIDELNKTIQNRETEVAAAKEQILKEIADGKSQNRVLYDSLQQSSERVTELQKTLKDKDDEIVTLKQKLVENDGNYKSLLKFMERGTEQIEILEAELQKKESIEQNYKALQAKYEDAVVTLERSSQESLENSTKMGELLESREKELTQLQEEFNVAKSRAEDADEYQATIEKMAEKLSLSEKMIAERENRIGTLEETVEEQEQQMQEHCERITASAREMKTVLEDADARQSTLEKALTELDGDLQESNKLNDDHEATIKVCVCIVVFRRSSLVLY